VYAVNSLAQQCASSYW